MGTLQVSGDFGVCVFDNSQIIKSLKFQQGGHSSNVSLVTLQLCLKPMIPNLISLLRWPSEKVPLTYSKQHIPLPPGMPVYESIEGITPCTFDGSTVCSTMMDITGDQVEAWAELALLAWHIYKFQRLLKAKDNERIEFQFEENIQAMQRLRINLKMQKNQPFYQQVKLFQHNETLKWRGTSNEANVIIPPVSPHDETTSTGAAKVILSLLTMFGILDSSNATNDVDHHDTILKTPKAHKNAKASSTPKRAKETCAVAEFLLILKICQEIPGRRFDDNKLWVNTTKCTVRLETESDQERAI